MNAAERLKEWGCEGVVVFTDFGYDSALIGVTLDNRAVYDFDKMVDWLRFNQGFEYDEAVEWIDYNTLKVISYAGRNAPIIMQRLPE